MPNVRHWQFTDDGQVNQTGQQSPENHGSGWRRKPSLVIGGGSLCPNKAHVWVSLLMVVLTIKCLGTMHVKDGPWPTSGCDILAKLLKSPECHFQSIRWRMWKRLFCRIIVIIPHKYIVWQIVFQMVTTLIHTSQSQMHWDCDRQPLPGSWGLYFLCLNPGWLDFSDQ